MVAKHAAIIGIADRQHCHALFACGRNQRLEAKIDRRMSKAGGGVHRNHRRRRAGQQRIRLPIDLAAAYMLAIDGDVGEAVAGDAVGLGRCGRLGERAGVGLRRSRGDEGAKGKIFDLIQSHDRGLVHRFSLIINCCR